MAALKYVPVPEVAIEMSRLQGHSPEAAVAVAAQLAKAGARLRDGMGGERPLPGPVGQADMYVYFEDEIVMFITATRTHLAIATLARVTVPANFTRAEQDARARAARLFP